MSQLFDIETLAAYLDVSKATIYGWRHDKADCPPAMKLQNRLRWRREDVDRWLESRLEDPAENNLKEAS